MGMWAAIHFALIALVQVQEAMTSSSGQVSEFDSPNFTTADEQAWPGLQEAQSSFFLLVT